MYWMCFRNDLATNPGIDPAQVGGLECVECQYLVLVPDMFTHLSHAVFYACPNLISIPTIASLTSLRCVDCPKLVSIPDRYLQTLTCINCDALSGIPTTLTLLRSLTITGCQYLITIYSFEELTVLTCSDCSNLTSISALPKLQTLNCSNCRLLWVLPRAPMLNSLNCTGCWSIQFVRDFPRLRKLDCSGCTSLTSIVLPELHILRCNSCPNLNDIPAYFVTKRIISTRNYRNVKKSLAKKRKTILKSVLEPFLYPVMDLVVEYACKSE